MLPYKHLKRKTIVKQFDKTILQAIVHFNKK